MALTLSTNKTLSADKGGAPGSLEIEAAGNGVYIKDFASEVEPFMALGLKRGKVHVAKGDTACGHELFPEGALAPKGIAVGG